MRLGVCVDVILDKPAPVARQDAVEMAVEHDDATLFLAVDITGVENWRSGHRMVDRNEQGTPVADGVLVPLFHRLGVFPAAVRIDKCHIVLDGAHEKVIHGRDWRKPRFHRECPHRRMGK